ncbi:hypothetical protein EZV62_027927 [Acer yangbiense]|uniref:Chromo domain-containing protein n=1 Tax=Acer yangbiense TaxID=1000413 RepID=A0A5C7GPR3_9ROSI|nr:hypothetical protein EZV62_027927 [Acer yangbiense]
MHPVFHVSILKKRIGEGQEVLKILPPLNNEDTTELKPQAVLEKRQRDGKVELLVHWRSCGLSPAEATWEEYDTIIGWECVYSLLFCFLFLCSLTDPIPTTLGDLNKLTVLHSFQNNLSSPIEIGNLKSLVSLCFYSNNLSGSIPTSFGGLRNLTLLYLYENQLSRLIPKELGNLISMIDLELSENQLSGLISEELGNLISLTYQDLRQNQITGSIPTSFGNLINLEVLISQS